MAKINPKLLELVNIKKFEYGAAGHWETEYYMEFQVVGTIGQIEFFLGVNDEDKYVVGARKFNNVEEVLEDMFEVEHMVTKNLTNETIKDVVRTLAVSLKKPQITRSLIATFRNPAKLHSFLKFLALKKLEHTPKYRKELEEFRHECNAVAESMDRLWREECDTWGW